MLLRHHSTDYHDNMRDQALYICNYQIPDIYWLYTNYETLVTVLLENLEMSLLFH